MFTIESVDSISRDEPDSPLDAIHYKRGAPVHDPVVQLISNRMSV